MIPEASLLVTAKTVLKKVWVGRSKLKCSCSQPKRKELKLLQSQRKPIQGLGIAKVKPVHSNSTVKPIPLQYMEKFKEHTEKLDKAGVVCGPLGFERVPRGSRNCHISCLA
eukprot:GFUD01020417.1.p1 GENE.GFUD01020417.1~~GFUD01020417.1.p1  ORF type:complete len:111 (+),score=20.55 GFUD01020417.1:158-490(+)